MWIGFSKSFGGGFRVGVGTRIGGKSSGPTQAQIAKLERAEFIKKIAEKTSQSYQEYLVNNNIDPAYAEKTDLNLDNLLGKGDVAPQYQKFKASMSEVSEIIKKVSYGGNLTASRKDRLVDLVFDLREIVDNSGPGLNELAIQISKKTQKTLLTTFLLFFFVTAILMALGLFADDMPVNSVADAVGRVIVLLVSAGLIAGILYFPVRFVIKLIAKIKYNRQAIAKTKQYYDLA